MVKVLKPTPLDLCRTKHNSGRDDDNSSTTLSRAGAAEEPPGIWVIQRNWREILEPKGPKAIEALKVSRENNDDHDFTVGVLGSGEFFGELAVLDKNETSPVTIVACTNMELYCLNHEDVTSLSLHVNHTLKRCLEESMVMHNPPAHKVAHFFRSKMKWENEKDKILQSCMSQKWNDAKKNQSTQSRTKRYQSQF